jgi:hypothetical protein
MNMKRESRVTKKKRTFAKSSVLTPETSLYHSRRDPKIFSHLEFYQTSDISVVKMARKYINLT